MGDIWWVELLCLVVMEVLSSVVVGGASHAWKEFKYSFEMLVGFGFYKVQVWCDVEVETRCRLELYGAW